MITGGLGLIGTHLTRQLVQTGLSEKSVHIIDTERKFPSPSFEKRICYKPYG